MARQTEPLSGRQWFGLGVLAGLVYGFVKHPAGCGCMLLIAVVVLASLVWAWWPWSGLVILLVGVPFYIPQWLAWFRKKR